MRWITLLGRIGTVILAIGLALFVFFLIPSGARYEPGGSQPIGPEQYMLEELWVYLPQTGLQISVESTDNVRVYLLGVSQVELDNWITLLSEAYTDPESPGLEMFIEVYTVPMIFFHEAYPEETSPNLDDPQTQSMVWNVTVLDKGLETHPEIILWGPPPGSSFSHELLPADALDIMVVIANPSSDTVGVDWKVKEIAAVAAKERVIVAARLLIPIGIALAIPWLVLRRVKKSTL
jgi:hypothetical protein